MPKEIERKFLVNQGAYSSIEETTSFPVKEMILIDQIYLSYIPEVRLREEVYLCLNKGDPQLPNRYFMVVKSEGVMERDEFTLILSRECYRELSLSAINSTIIKLRSKIVLEDGLIAELDDYRNFLFRTVEVEFPTIEVANSFIPPQWFGDEVTNDPRYKNKNLAQRLDKGLENEDFL